MRQLNIELDTLLTREPGPRIRPLKGAKGQGPLEAIGPSNGMRERMQSENHVKMRGRGGHGHVA
jgi:hypothetical protein